ncbi:glycosyltransferase family 39 protein [Streptomyces sp. NPDC000594]|uniref:glycosyltransferase family 39 protein n=1 Tax=Streptomyces sp. NPDC000594 TaxID=3154261 RepID=UPI00332B7806
MQTSPGRPLARSRAQRYARGRPGRGGHSARASSGARPQGRAAGGRARPPVPAPPGAGGVLARARDRRLALGGVLLLAVLVRLAVAAPFDGADAAHTAAVRAGLESGKAFLFGSVDAANASTVDHPPAALWVTGVSVRLLGTGSPGWLLPPVLLGAATVVPLYAAVRRTAGPGAGLLAGAVFALAPLVDRGQTAGGQAPLAVLLLTVSAYTLLRAVEEPPPVHRRLLFLAAGCAGLALLTEVTTALLSLPVFALVQLVCAPGRRAARLGRLGAAGLLVLVTAGWWPALAELWPEGTRPYIGGSAGNSVLERDLRAPAGSWAQGPPRWLPPAGVAAVTVAVRLARRARFAPPAAGPLLWGGLLAVHGLTPGGCPAGPALLVPAVAALAATGPAERRRGHRVPPSWLLLLGTALAAAVVAQTTGRASVPVPMAVGLGVVAVVVLLAGVPLRRTERGDAAARTVEGVRAVSRAGAGAVAVLLVAALSWPVPPGRTAGERPAPCPAELVAALRKDSGSYTWAAAVVRTHEAARWHLASGAPVMAVGGPEGVDPSPSLERFRQLARAGRIHYFIVSPGTGPGAPPGGPSPAAELIGAWVAARHPARTVGGYTAYDLSAPVRERAAVRDLAPVKGWDPLRASLRDPLRVPLRVPLRG